MIYLELFVTFFKIGLFTFGGGYAMLPLIEQEVMSHGWLTAEEIVNFIAVSESTPGPFAINISTYVGVEMAGIPGAFMATFGVVLPSFVIILIVARVYEAFRKNRIVKGCMEGLKPAVVGFIGAALISVGSAVFFPNGFYAGAFARPAFGISLAIFAVSALMAVKKLHPIIIIAFSAVVGLIIGFIAPGLI